MGFQRDKSLWRVKGSALAGMQGQRPCPAHLSLMQALRWENPPSPLNPKNLRGTRLRLLCFVFLRAI